MQFSDKASLRQQILSQRPQSSEGLFANLVRIAMEFEAKAIASYAPLNTEPDVSDFNDWVLATGRTLCLPRIIGAEIEFAIGQTEPGAFSIPEPVGDAIDPSAIDLIMVPALAVDAQGNRLGKGKGYYDRALTSISCPKFAVIFDSEYFENLPHEDHDQAVDGAISPSAINYFARPEIL
ncbi:5-formyltetrahydrofolate cyclo-ligase [Aquiluna sp. KACHI24]|uniref:5-formyltetrahydrofolate cyclo-ligase n=1 Tax=Aquiluna sp. KACHI24 TaxID=2968831 RepID=UPI0022302DE4|nr:5-formyltetrahydrofolate cyclo-ligase [Aquiluna sp. KACHI24]